MQHEDKNEYLRSNNYFLEADGLTMHFPAASDNLGRTVSWIHGADDVSFRVPKGKTLGVVGESGCGKSTVGKMLLDIYHPTSGRIFYEGTDITNLSAHERRPYIKKMQLVWQDPYSSLDPRMRAGDIIAEGMESGGHVGEMTTMALVPQVIDTVDVPVIAAGGIADGRQAAAAFALGACGIQVGTCLLTSRECPIHENYKLALLKAKDSDTTVTGRSIGGPVRVLKNKMAREYLALEKRGATLEELEHVTLGGLRRAVFEGDMERGSVMAGQVAGMLHEIKPLRQIFEELYNSSRAVLKATEAAWQ